MSRERYFPEMPESRLTPKKAKNHLINRMGYSEEYLNSVDLDDNNLPHMLRGLVDIMRGGETEYYAAIAKYREQDDSRGFNYHGF